MTIADRIVLGLLWLRWFNARQTWRFYAGLTSRFPDHPRARRRCMKMEFFTWRQSCAAAARFDREKRRVLS